MTSRERILAALSGGKPDRLPTDVGATEHTGVLPEVYGPLKDGLGMSGGHTRISNPFCGTVRIERTFLDKLGVDAAGLFHEPRRWRAGELPDGTSCLLPEKWQPQEGPDGAEVVRHPIADFTLLRRPGEGWFSYQYDKAPLAGCRSREDLNRRLQTIALFDWPYHVDEIASEFGVRARERRKGTERAFVLNIRARIIGGAVVLRGDAFFRDLEENEALAEALLAWSGATPSARGVAAVRTIAGVDPAFLEAAYDALERDWGSVPAYLLEAGLDAPVRERLRAALLG